MKSKRLQRDFFTQDTLTVAQALLGKTLHFNQHQIIITETEAYIGSDDPACHAAKGKTPRTAVMFGPAGYSYVYLIYGMYFCLNIVTEQEDFPAAVLIRGGVDVKTQQVFDGPGKLCRALGITKQHNALDLIKHNDFYLRDDGHKLDYKSTPRIGIKVGVDKLWRFIHEIVPSIPSSSRKRGSIHCLIPDGSPLSRG